MQPISDWNENHLPEGPTSPPEVPEPSLPEELPGTNNPPKEVPPPSQQPELPEKIPPETPPAKEEK